MYMNTQCIIYNEIEMMHDFIKQMVFSKVYVIKYYIHMFNMLNNKKIKPVANQWQFCWDINLANENS